MEMNLFLYRGYDVMNVDEETMGNATQSVPRPFSFLFKGCFDKRNCGGCELEDFFSFFLSWHLERYIVFKKFRLWLLSKTFFFLSPSSRFLFRLCK